MKKKFGILGLVSGLIIVVLYLVTFSDKFKASEIEAEEVNEIEDGGIKYSPIVKSDYIFISEEEYKK